METKESILLTALRLFARDGFEAVSVSQAKILIGGMAADVTREHKNRLQSMKIKYIQSASP